MICDFIVLVCEHTRGETVTCPEGMVINVLFAVYGRLNTTICKYRNTRSTTCASTNMGLVFEECQGKQTCFMKATNSWFGDPCKGIHKYLHIKYQCLPYRKGWQKPRDIFEERIP